VKNFIPGSKISTLGTKLRVQAQNLWETQLCFFTRPVLLEGVELICHVAARHDDRRNAPGVVRVKLEPGDQCCKGETGPRFLKVTGFLQKIFYSVLNLWLVKLICKFVAMAFGVLSKFVKPICKIAAMAF
jgi:hypothetical protein